jgi:DNA-binding winged helix-turn-helix (wHTH) protein
MMEFAGFRLDPKDERLWKAGREVALRRKPFAILRYLVTNPGRLVTHAELLEHVWGGAVVSESAMRSQLHELRQVLGDGVIDTVIGRGYRFAAAVVDGTPPARGNSADARDSMVVGRDRELATLRSALVAAHRGERQMCFVTGDPGIGKTTLVDAFIAGCDPEDVLVLRGSSIEQHGTPEAYAPVIEMLSGLRQSPHREHVLAALTKCAPTFVLHVSHLLPDETVSELRERARRAGEARPISELVETFEALASRRTLVVVHEDLQWSDLATLDLLAMLGTRRGPARMLVVGTARSGDAQTVTHPLNRVMRSLVSRGTATAIPLGQIGEAEVAHYLALRYPHHQFPSGFVQVVTTITDGTPLFLVSLVDELARREMIVEGERGASLAITTDELAAHRADSVRQLIDMQLDRLTRDEQRVLEAASVIGQDFSTALVAAALEAAAETVDEWCDWLARRQLFLRRESIDEWPDGVVHTRYAFRHALVQEVCTERASLVRRQAWHRLVAERLERAYGGDPSPVAHVLAMHFDLAHVATRAVAFYVLAAERNERRFASADALQMSQRARELLIRIPAGAERDELELAVLGHLSQVGFRVIVPMAQPFEVFERMVTLARATNDPLRLARALVNLSFRCSTFAQYRRASDTLDEVDAIANTTQLPPDVVGFAGLSRAVALAWQGQLAAAKELLTQLIALPLPFDPVNPSILGPTNRAGMLRSFLAFVTWAGGDPEGGFAEAVRVCEMAEASGDGFFLGAARVHVARYRLLRGDPPAEVRALASTVLELSEAAPWHILAATIVAWADACTGALDDARMDAIVAGCNARVTAFPQGATNVALPLIAMLRAAGRDALALEVADRAIGFGREHEELTLEPELLRLRGELLEPTRPAEAEAAYVEALARGIACGAHSFALRAATRLAAVWHATPRSANGYDQLAAALDRIAPGTQTAEVIEARTRLSMRA